MTNVDESLASKVAETLGMTGQADSIKPIVKVIAAYIGSIRSDAIGGWRAS